MHTYYIFIWALILKTVLKTWEKNANIDKYIDKCGVARQCSFVNDGF